MGHFYVDVTKETTLLELRRLVSKANLFPMDGDSCGSEIKLYLPNEDANDDSLNDLYSDKTLVLQDILDVSEFKREIDYKMFTGKVKTDVESLIGPIEIIFAKNENNTYQIETVDENGTSHHLKSFKTETAPISRWVRFLWN